MSEKLEELQAEINSETCLDITAHLDCAETCETLEDFRDNIQNAINDTGSLLSDLYAMRDKAKVIK
mgnify:CR=1 FL=1